MSGARARAWAAPVGPWGRVLVTSAPVNRCALATHVGPAAGRSRSALEFPDMAMEVVAALVVSGMGAQ